MTQDIRSKYFIRVKNTEEFEAFLKSQGRDYAQLSMDLTSGSFLYSVDLDSEEALSIKLKFQLEGCMNFTRTLGKLKDMK